MSSVRRWMSKWLSTSITFIANSLHRNRSFWTERKNFIVWVKRTHVDRLIERTRARMREKYSPTHVKSWRWRYVSNRTPIKCPQLQTRYVWSLFISSLRKVVVFVASFCPGFYNRIMVTCSPSQERQLVLMESMNRRLDTFSASQKKLEEKTQRFSKKTSSCDSTELSKQERLNNTKRGSKRKRTE